MTLPQTGLTALSVETLRHRREFLACARGRRFTTAAFVLQRNARDDAGADRFGYTVTKKTGNSPARSRIKRRLRAVVREVAGLQPHSGADYVLVARGEALSQPFEALKADLLRSLDRLTRPAKDRPSPPSSHPTD